MVKNSVTQQPETTAVRQALIVEGSATYRRTLCKVFAQAGYRTSGVENLNHALAALTQAAYNLVVIDLFSPYQGRLGLLQTIVAKASRESAGPDGVRRSHIAGENRCGRRTVLPGKTGQAPGDSRGA